MKRLSALLMVLAMLFACAASAEEMELYQLWTGEGDIPLTEPESLIHTEKIETTVIIEQLKELDYGHNVFLHGISIAEYKGALVATFGINPNGENMHGERCYARWSYDGGQTWGDLHCFESSNPTLPHTSHGSLLVHEEKLYAYVPATNFKGNNMTDIWLYDDASASWIHQGFIRNLWPSSPVAKMADGNYIVGGGALRAPSVAVSINGDPTQWKIVRLPYASTGFQEVGLVVQGDTVMALVRPEQLMVPDSFGVAEKRGSIMVTTSLDYGKTFSKTMQSNIYSSKSEICGGTLSDGRPFAIFNMEVASPTGYKPARLRLLMAVGDPGTTTFNRLYCIKESSNPLSYPYTIEKDGVLYVAYSELIPIADHTINADRMPNSNDVKLMKIPLECIP